MNTFPYQNPCPPARGPSSPNIPCPPVGGHNYPVNPCPSVRGPSIPNIPCPPVGGPSYPINPCPPPGGQGNVWQPQYPPMSYPYIPWNPCPPHGGPGYQGGQVPSNQNGYLPPGWTWPVPVNGGNLACPPCDPIRGPNTSGSPCPEVPISPSPLTPPNPCPVSPQVPCPETPQIPCPEVQCPDIPETPVLRPGRSKSPVIDEYFSIPRTPPSSPVNVVNCPEEPLEYDELGQLQRCRAPPGMFPDIELVDAPGMGFPVPRAALERGGRTRGQTVPLTPPSPPLPRQGRFRPLAASSPYKPGDLRPSEVPACPPPHPMAGQPLDPALLPKIQEDLEQLAEKNRNLQDIVRNFRCIRSMLTEEIDKAVRLNQKLQRDLCYVVETQRCQQA